MPEVTVNRRASDRFAVNLAARCRVPATPHPVTLLDLSRTGCRVRISTVHVTPGTTVHIDLNPAASVSGQVAWSGPQTAGVKFHRRLDTAVAVQLGIEDAPAAADDPIAVTDPARGGLQHWIRAVFGFVKN